MPVVEDRLSLLEVKMQEVGATLVRMEGMLSSVHQMVVALDQRVVALDQRVVALDQRMDTLDHRVDRLELRIDRLDDRAVKLFLWVIGIQMTTLITIAAGLFAMVARLIPNP